MLHPCGPAESSECRGRRYVGQYDAQHRGQYRHRRRTVPTASGRVEGLGAPTVGSCGAGPYGHVSSPRLLKCSLRIFPALRFPVCFASRVMWPIRSGALSQQPAATGLDGSLRTVPAARTATSYSTSSNRIHGDGEPASCAAVSSSLPCGERSQNTGSNARTRSSSPPQDRVDDRHHPSHQSRLIPSEYLLELARQRGTLLDLRGVVGSPHSPPTAYARNSNPRNPKLSPFARSTVRLLSSFTATCRSSNSSRSRLSAAASSQSCRRCSSTRITRSSAQRAYSTCVYRPVRVGRDGETWSAAAIADSWSITLGSRDAGSPSGNP